MPIVKDPYQQTAVAGRHWIVRNDDDSRLYANARHAGGGDEDTFADSEVKSHTSRGSSKNAPTGRKPKSLPSLPTAVLDQVVFQHFGVLKNVGNVFDTLPPTTGASPMPEAIASAKDLVLVNKRHPKKAEGTLPPILLRSGTSMLFKPKLDRSASYAPLAALDDIPTMVSDGNSDVGSDEEASEHDAVMEAEDAICAAFPVLNIRKQLHEALSIEEEFARRSARRDDLFDPEERPTVSEADLLALFGLCEDSVHNLFLELGGFDPNDSPSVDIAFRIHDLVSTPLNVSMNPSVAARIAHRCLSLLRELRTRSKRSPHENERKQRHYQLPVSFLVFCGLSEADMRVYATHVAPRAYAEDLQRSFEESSGPDPSPSLLPSIDFYEFSSLVSLYRFVAARPSSQPWRLQSTTTIRTEDSFNADASLVFSPSIVASPDALTTTKEQKNPLRRTAGRECLEANHGPRFATAAFVRCDTSEELCRV